MQCNDQLTAEEQEEELNSRFKHLLTRLDKLVSKPADKFQQEMSKVIDTLKNSMLRDSFEQKQYIADNLLSKFPKEFVDFYHNVLDKQYLNEELRIQKWFVQEMIPDIKDSDMVQDMLEMLRRFDEAYKTDDLDEKFDKFATVDEHISPKLTEFLDNYESNPILLNVHLKYFQKFLNYLLDGNAQPVLFADELRSLLTAVENARNDPNVAEKYRVVNIFDDVATKIGRYINDKVIEYEIIMFGDQRK